MTFDYDQEDRSQGAPRVTFHLDCGHEVTRPRGNKGLWGHQDETRELACRHDCRRSNDPNREAE